MRGVGMIGLVGIMLGIAIGSSTAQELKNETEPKLPEIKWPERIQGKSVHDWVRTMRESKDASMRDQAIRTIPFFGPESNKAVGHSLIDVINSDKDLSVRLTAIATVPLIGFEPTILDDGIDAMIAVLKHPNNANHTRFETTTALGACGPLFRRAIPTIIATTLVDPISWQNRKAAAKALGRLGLPTGKDASPDKAAIIALSKALYGEKRDPSHLVRREVVNALLQLGPPTDEPTWKLLRAALTETMKDPDKTVALWAHVTFTRTEQELIKPSDPNLLAVVKTIAASDIIIKHQKEEEAKLDKLIDSPDLEVKRDAQQRKQTAIQVKQEAIDMKQDAVQALGVIGEEASSHLPDLIAIVEEKHQEIGIMVSSLWAMSQMPSQTNKILPVIDPLKRAEDKTIKAAAEAAYKVLTEKPDPEKKKDPPPK